MSTFLAVYALYLCMGFWVHRIANKEVAKEAKRSYKETLAKMGPGVSKETKTQIKRSIIKAATKTSIASAVLFFLFPVMPFIYLYELIFNSKEKKISKKLKAK